MQVDMLLEAVPYSAMRRSYEDGQKQEEVGRDLISRRIQAILSYGWPMNEGLTFEQKVPRHLGVAHAWETGVVRCHRIYVIVRSV